VTQVFTRPVDALLLHKVNSSMLERPVDPYSGLYLVQVVDMGNESFTIRTLSPITHELLGCRDVRCDETVQEAIEIVVKNMEGNLYARLGVSVWYTHIDDMPEGVE
jgi:hypothetical protein